MNPTTTPGPIAYQGAPGAFSEEAALAFAPGATLLPCASFADVFAALADGRAARAAVPIENTLAGTVRDVARALATRAVRIEAETRVRVSHALVAAPGTALADVRRVLSHPVALRQCERFFREHPAIEPVAAFDTAGAAAEVVQAGRRDEAALASERAAAMHGGAVLARALEDDPANFTRFLLLAREGEAAPPPPGGTHKVSLLFRARHEPGALWRCLGEFAGRGLDLTRIESHPVPGSPFEYEFLIDVTGPASSPALAEGIAALRGLCSRVRELGRYAPATE